MKKVFELQLNGKFLQYLMPSETNLLKWESGKVYTITPVLISTEKYKAVFGKK